MRAEPLQPGQVEHPRPSAEGGGGGGEPREGDGAPLSDGRGGPAAGRRQAHPGTAQERWHQGRTVSLNGHCLFFFVCLFVFSLLASEVLYAEANVKTQEENPYAAFATTSELSFPESPMTWTCPVL